MNAGRDRVLAVEGEWQPVSRRLIPVELLSSAGVFACGLGVALLPLLLGLPWGVWVWVLPVGVLCWWVIDVVCVPRRVAARGIWVRADDIVVRSGLLVRRSVAVPFGRLQVVDLNQGPLLRRFGLVSMRVETASGGTSCSVPGLLRADAELLRDELIALAESRRAGL